MTATVNQYFIDGVMEEILTNLSRIHDLRVVSRTSVEQFRESKTPTSEIAKKLHVDYVVEGSGQKYGNSLSLRVQLIDASKDKQSGQILMNRRLVSLKIFSKFKVVLHKV